jgi:pilus assembly protein FimV
MVAKLLSRALVVLAAVPAVAHALGLGDIRLNSSLNAPLDAEIALDATSEELAALRAEVASRDTFSRYGLDFPAFLSSVTLTQTRGADGRPVIRVRSTEAITEPFVTFLVEVNWPRGRLVREYTMLLDPPVYTPVAQTPAAPVAAPLAAETQRTGNIEREPATSEPAPSSQPADTTPFVAPSASSGDSYQVARGDTLSSIQRRMNPAEAAAARQWMVAVYQANPQAFDGNMNVLRAGSVLRIPDSNAVASVDPAMASAEIRRQFTAWRGAAAPTGAEPGRLRLVTPSEPGAGTGESGSRVSELEGRISDLESQIADKDRLLELRNAELAQLQARLAAAAGGQATPAEPAPTPVEPSVAETTTPDGAPVTEAPTETTEQPPVAAEPSAAAGAEEPAPTPAVTAQQPAQEESGGILDTILGLWWLLALAVLAVLGLLGLRAWRARKADEFDDNIGRLAAAGAESLAREPTIAPSALRQPPLAAGPREQAAFLVEESGTHERPRFEETRPAPVAARPVTTDETISSETAINLDQGDPLAEADFHMAYGLYDQAADLVRIAIAREPERRDLKLKLLEVFFVWGNKDQFLQTARELAETRAQAAPGEWEKIVIMGKQLAPEDALFAGGAAFSGAAAGGVDLDLEGGQNRVDFDLLGEPVSGGQANDGIDLDIGGALGDGDPTGNSTALADTQEGEGIGSATTRQMTQKLPPRGDVLADFSSDNESPTVEQPGLHSQDKTVRQKLETALKHQGVDQTAELAIDDLGLDLGSLDTMDNPALSTTQETPTLVAGLDDRSRRIMEDARSSADDTQQTPTGSWNLGDVDLGPSDSTLPPSTVRAIDSGSLSTNDPSHTTQLPTGGIDFDLGDVGEEAHQASNGHGIDLDVGPAAAPDTAFTATQKLPAEDLALPDLEPVTMSEVGTKLDLARAYMDMGDPEGARNILEEVLQEGSVAQKQEAQRLIESLPG